MYKIVVVKPFDDFQAGDELETVMYDDDYSIRRYIANKYLVEGMVVKAVKC